MEWTGGGGGGSIGRQDDRIIFICSSAPQRKTHYSIRLRASEWRRDLTVVLGAAKHHDAVGKMLH